nr:hypothetical protein [Endozoicomonas sp.]
MKFLRHYLLPLTTFFLLTPSLTQAESNCEVIPTDDEMIKSEIRYADVSLHFLPGTAFIAWIATRSGEDQIVHNHGKYFAGDHWQVKLPVGSRIKVGTKGFGSKFCQYFTVANPSSSSVNFWSTPTQPDFAIVGGNAIQEDTNVTTELECPAP